MNNKKAQAFTISDLGTVAVALVVAVIILGLGATILYRPGLPKNTKMIPITIAAAATIAMVGTKLDNVFKPVRPNCVLLNAIESTL